MNLSELNGEQLQARLEELKAETSEEKRDALGNDELEARITEMEAIQQEIDARKAAAAEEARKCEEAAKMSGKPIIEEKTEVKHMERNSVEYRDLWIKNLQGHLNEEEARAYAAADANNAVPTLVSDKMFEKMKKLAPMLSEITLLRVAGNVKFATEGVRNTAVKHTENSAMTAAADTIVNVTLGGFEFMKVIQISRTAALMSVNAFEDWLVEMLAGDIARAIDDYIINDATNGIAALTYTTGTNQILDTATTGYKYADICDLIALLPAAYDAEAKFLTNKKTLYGQIAQIVDSAKRPIFVPDTVNGIGGTLMGYPVVVDDYVTTANGAVYLGKWTDVVGNLPEDIHVDRDESAGFTANAIVYRGISVFDSKPAKGDAIVRLVTTA
ncbi:MAG: phage major capsid protein [Oscillospiraceae bacterium]|nr:phage major capsid protein [Oscillospiraceae bacterium]